MPTNNDDKILVAVYGTLKKGFSNHRLLESSKFLGKSVVKGTMYSLGAFPAVVLGGPNNVYVELYEVDKPTLQRLDNLEGHPGFYTRVETYIASYGRINIYTMTSDAPYLKRASIEESGNWGSL